MKNPIIHFLALVFLIFISCSDSDDGGFNDLVVVDESVETPVFDQYDDAPATPDADDTAIWINRADPSNSLIIGTLKDAGLAVFDLEGNLIQAIAPPNLPSISPEDPPTPVGINAADPVPCPESESGETFGRFNNVAVSYDVELGDGSGSPIGDVAVVTDRGCDRVRFYLIDPDDSEVPLLDITSPDVPRVFEERFVQPSPLQPSDLDFGFQDNPLDEEDTAYGLGVWDDGDEQFAFVSQRNRGVVKQLQIVANDDGSLSYAEVRILYSTCFSVWKTAPSYWNGRLAERIPTKIHRRRE